MYYLIEIVGLMPIDANLILILLAYLKLEG